MASRKSADPLPPIPPSLKAVQPFLQRAEELRTKDPIMAYWCTYYAAQLGLDLKSHEPGAREFLLSLITLLENVKSDLGANDAIDNEAAGAAYVENFALKVFSLADNEDRKGESTRATAKKFLAAANFLELLKVFEKTNNAQVNEEKVRYAKWKASEIAKAIREGRKPSPGAVDEHLKDPVEEGSPKSAPSTMESSSVRTPSDHPAEVPPIISVDTIDAPHTPPRKPKALHPTIEVPSPAPLSPGNWSTVATPGSDIGGLPNTAANLAFASVMNRMKGADGSDGSPLKGRGGLNLTVHSEAAQPELPLKKVHFSPSVVGGLSSDGSAPVSPEMGSRAFTTGQSIPPPPPSIPIPKAEPRSVPTNAPQSSARSNVDPTVAPLPDSSPSSSGSPKEIRGSASPPKVSNGKTYGSPTDGSSRLSGSPLGAGGAKPGSSPPRSTTQPSAPPFLPPSATPSAPPMPPAPTVPATGRERRSSLSSRNSPPQQPNAHSHPVAPPSMPPANASFSSTSTSTYVSTSIPPSYPPKKPSDFMDSTASFGSISKPNVISGSYNPYAAPSAPAPFPPSPPFELTPQIIAKVQKHCRYAISSLEYEDAEQARKELRAALKALGEP